MKHLVSFSKTGPRNASAEFRIGLRSAPYLADHGFQDMVVLPGSFCIGIALSMDHELSGHIPSSVRNVVFDSPVILSSEDTLIKVEATDRGESCVEYTFYESAVEDDRARRRYAAKVEIDRTVRPSSRAATTAFSIEAFQGQSHSMIDSDALYKKLRKSGNQYGTSFRNISVTWRAGDQCLGRLSVPHKNGEMEPHYLHPALVDSMTQLLAPLIMESGKTFILRSIGKIELINLNFPATLWGHATRLVPDKGDNDFVGNVRIFDESGNLYLELSGVAFALLDRVDAASERTGTNLVIASNFTAEPLEDSLTFWGDYFGAPVQVEFAPYNQVFQQLLDGDSAFRKNREGTNVILLSLEEWLLRDRPAGMTLDKRRAEQCFGDRPTCVLPNGLEIAHLNQYETNYLYKEIFEDQCYLRHGIRLRDGATVVDIGANIGLFSLFVMSRCKNPRIYAFEPGLDVYEILKANCDAYGSNAQTLNLGVSDKAKTATFAFYEKSSVFSGFHPDETEDREAIQTVVRNMLSRESTAESLEDYVHDLTADRLRRRSYDCRLVSVSDIIRDNQIDRIDLLKIDAEKSEKDIIQGIHDSDWAKIDQIVVEIHDRTGEMVERMAELLKGKGYKCAVEHEELLEDSGLFNLYATRGNRDEVRCDTRVAGLKRNVQDFSTALRSFMSPGVAPLVLCVCPRTPMAAANAGLTATLADAEQTLLSETSQIPNVYTISSASLLRRYPVEHCHDAESKAVGHIPYTQEFYAAIGTAIVRTVFNVRANRFKVIALDCDHTLWKGVCGEDGLTGIEVSAPYRLLQEFMLGQMKAGMLLCLCSKNNEKDVLDVFDQRPDMVLRREHMVSWRLNWNSKSANIKSLANELNLALESFIFIDDNPIDCADVRINCPGVLTLQLPQSAESFAAFLNHIWPFDRGTSTEEDQHRTRMYQQNAQRQRFREQALSLKDFVKGLELRVDIAEVKEEQLSRVSQLTLRTNQFNFRTIRRSENEIRDFLKGHARCLVVRVVDRFGDYGLAGVVLYEADSDRYKVDTMLLSCRVLGRGAEHAVASWLGQQAVKEGIKFVEFTYQPTERNLPALEFITSIGDQYRNESGTTWNIPSEYLASVRYAPNQSTGNGVPATGDRDNLPLRAASAWDVADQSERFQQIGEKLCDIDHLMKAIEEYRFREHPRCGAAIPTAGHTLEATLLTIWRKVLGRPGIGLNDNFFEAGGNSLRAVQVIAKIKRELKQDLSIVSLFECPTVTLIANRLKGGSGTVPAGTEPAEAVRRGQRRRCKTMRQAA